MAKRGRRANYVLSNAEWAEFARLVALVARANGYYVLFIPRRSEIASRIWTRMLRSLLQRVAGA